MSTEVEKTMNTKKFQIGQIVKIVEKNTSNTKIGLIMVTYENIVLIDQLIDETENNYMQVDFNNLENYLDINYLLKSKIRLDCLIKNAQLQFSGESKKFPLSMNFFSLQLNLSSIVKIKENFDLFYKEELMKLESHIKFRIFEIDKSKEDLQEILNRLEIKIQIN